MEVVTLQYQSHVVVQIASTRRFRCGFGCPIPMAKSRCWLSGSLDAQSHIDTADSWYRDGMYKRSKYVLTKQLNMV
jgi:hypothetical protein